MLSDENQQLFETVEKTAHVRILRFDDDTRDIYFTVRVDISDFEEGREEEDSSFITHSTVYLSLPEMEIAKQVFPGVVKEINEKLKKVGLLLYDPQLPTQKELNSDLGWGEQAKLDLWGVDRRPVMFLTIKSQIWRRMEMTKKENEFLNDLLEHVHPTSVGVVRKMWEDRDRYMKMYIISSFSDEERKVVVAQREDRGWVCSCPHFVFRLQKSGGECKHIAYVKEHKDELKPFWDIEEEINLKLIEEENSILPFTNYVDNIDDDWGSVEVMERLPDGVDVLGPGDIPSFEDTGIEEGIVGDFEEITWGMSADVGTEELEVSSVKDDAPGHDILVSSEVGTDAETEEPEEEVEDDDEWEL